MILQVAADRRRVRHRRDAEPAQLLRRADA